MNESFNKRTICAALNAGSGDEQHRRAGAPERCGKAAGDFREVSRADHLDFK